MRQKSSKHEFLQCLKEVRVGKCTEDSQKTINNLERKLPVDLDKDAVHTFFKKIPVQLHNLKELRALPGEFVTLDATDEGKTSSIQCLAEKTIFLKPGCKIMLLWNINERLRNGSTGTFVLCDEMISLSLLVQL